MITYSINLEHRLDRLKHTKEEFEKYPEFQHIVISAIKNDCGAIGLWDTIQLIVKDHSQISDSNFLIICEDDHFFTKGYSHKMLLKCIETADELEADILLGGVSWLDMAMKVNQSLFWVENFTGTQFIILYKRFYSKILEVQDFTFADTADKKFCELSENKFLISPFISAQKEFGYSDATTQNNIEGRVTMLFEQASKTIEVLNNVNKYFSKF